MRKNSKIIYIIGSVIIGIIALLVILFAMAASGLADMPRTKIVLTSSSLSKEYDGTPLTGGTWTVTDGTIDDGHIINVTVTGARTDAGIADNTLSASVTDAAGNDVTYMYEFEYRPGTLTVNPRRINVVTGSKTKVYDGTPLKCDEWEVVSGSVIDGDTLTVLPVGSATDVVQGRVPNSATYAVTNERGDNVTMNYDIVVTRGTLEVVPRKIAIRTGTAQKPYDGTPLKCEEWTFVSATELVEGHEAEVYFSGEQTFVGKSDNTVAEIVIRDVNGVNVSGNYSIVESYGELSVTGNDGSGGEKPGGDGDLDLDESGNIGGDMTGGEGDKASDVLRIDTEKGGRVYLRYISYGDYTGKGWLPGVEYGSTLSGYSMNYLTGLALKNAGFDSAKMRIELLSTKNYMLPYYTEIDRVNDQSLYTVQKSDVKYSGESSTYTLYYYPFDYTQIGSLVGGLPSAYDEAEKAYRAFVYANYLAVPRDTEIYMTELLHELGLSASDDDIVSAVARYIRTSATYNMRYNRALDEEADIAVSFLRDYKQGVCRHYASAATLMYRALGIPARYVNGYACDAKANDLTSVTAKMAHAWVEVYIDGVGWVCVEVTGGSGDGNGEFVPGDSDGNGNGSADGKKLDIMPETVYLHSDKDGANLRLDETYETSGLRGLSALVEKGYTYSAVVRGVKVGYGKGASEIISFVLRDESGKDVTDEFDITFGKGALHIYRYALTVTTGSASKTYDGTAISADGELSVVVSGDLGDGHRISSLTVTGSQTSVGKSRNGYTIKIMDASNSDVTDMYKINSDYGVLEVFARKIKITASSATKTFDDSPLTSPYYTLDGELASGHTLTAVVTGSQTRIGYSDNVVSKYTISDGAGKDVTFNYDTELVTGRLTVTP